MYIPRPHTIHTPFFSENHFVATYPTPHSLSKRCILEVWETLLSAPPSYFKSLRSRLCSAIKTQMLSTDALSEWKFVHHLRAEYELGPNTLLFQNKGELMDRMSGFLEVLACLRKVEEAVREREREWRVRSPVPTKREPKPAPAKVLLPPKPTPKPAASETKPAQQQPGTGTQILNDLGQMALHALVNQAGAQGQGQMPQNQHYQPPLSPAIQQPQYPAQGYNYPPAIPAAYNPYPYPHNHFPPPIPYPYPYPYSYAPQNPIGSPNMHSPQQNLSVSQPAQAQSPAPKPDPFPRHFPARYPSRDLTEVSSVNANQRKDRNANVNAAGNGNANRGRGR